MTRETAIKGLKAFRKEFSGYEPNEEMFDMAISALEHPERNVVAVVPCGDAISRSDVLKLMQDNWHTHNGDWAMQESLDDIRALPSVTPQEPFINKPCASEKVCEHDKQMVLEKINKMKSEIADSLEFWDYSPSNNPLARDMLETLTKFWGDIKAEVRDKE